MGWLRMMGLSLRLGRVESQYSRASTFTLRWSIPSWQMSACWPGKRSEAQVASPGDPLTRKGTTNTAPLSVRGGCISAFRSSCTGWGTALIDIFSVFGFASHNSQDEIWYRGDAVMGSPCTSMHAIRFTRAIATCAGDNYISALNALEEILKTLQR